MPVRRKPQTLRPVYPNAGLEALYRRKLTDLIEEMHNSVTLFLRAAYRRNTPVMAEDAKVSKETAQYRDFPSDKEHCKLCTMFIDADQCTAVRGKIYRWGWCSYFERKSTIAQDISPAQAIRAAFRKLARRWLRNWNQAAQELAAYFAKSAYQRSDSQLESILKKSGIAVDFHHTPATRDIMHATVHQNVALIKSIPQRYLTQVEVLVTQSVQRGGDLKSLSDALQQQFRVTKKRAALIARDQNRKTTSAFMQARYLELDIKEAIWLHSGGGKDPRPNHVAKSGKRYDVQKGWWDKDANGKGKGAWIQPGWLINCRCVSKPILPGS